MPTVDELLARGGGPVLAVLVASPNGRWQRELAASTPLCARALALVHGRSRTCVPESEQGVPLLAGLAVLQSWKAVTTSISSNDSRALMLAAREHHSRRDGQLYVEHEVLSSAGLPEVRPGVVASHGVSGVDLDNAPAAFSARKLIGEFGGLALIVRKALVPY